ncbi:MAG: hypothetical protein ACJ8MR_04190 [Povalibacter sp.]
MKTKLSIAVLAVLCLGAATTVLADCAADSTVAQTKQRYVKAQQLESAGNLEAAFGAYVGAQDYTCEPNPVEAAAAQRAAALASKLGAVAEKSGNFEKAFHIYNDGGQYAAADRALMAWVRANPDDPSVFKTAREAFDYRSLPAFAANNKVRLGVTGAYQPDSKNIAEVLAMPEKGAERAFRNEVSLFNEDFLRAYVQRIQARPDDATDMAAVQAYASAQQAFAQKWSKFTTEAPLKGSLRALELVQTWATATNDRTLGEKIEAQRNQRLQQRATTLVKNYSGAPDLLEAAIDYQMAVRSENDAGKQTQVAAIKTQAGQLGDAANAKQRYELAVEYYDLADQDAKAQATRDTQQKLAMAKMQPQMDQAQKYADQLKKEYSDPAKVQAMREQALAMQKSLQEQQKANAKTNAKKADDLEKELGL